MVVSIRKDGSGDSDDIAYGAFRGITSAVYLRLNLFNDDSLAAFDRFHSNSIPKNVRCVEALVSTDRSLYASYLLQLSRL